jgi:hypothetical protein
MPIGKHTPKMKLTDAERHKRFVEMAEKVKASEDRADFDAAFDKVAKPLARHSHRNEKPVSS